MFVPEVHLHSREMYRDILEILEISYNIHEKLYTQCYFHLLHSNQM